MNLEKNLSQEKSHYPDYNLLSHIIDGSDADNLGIAGIEKVFDSAGIQYAVRDGLQKSINEFNDK